MDAIAISAFNDKSETIPMINDGNLILLNLEHCPKTINDENFILNRLVFDNGPNADSEKPGEPLFNSITIFIRSQNPLNKYNVGSRYKLNFSDKGVTIDKKFYDIKVVTVFR
jgi:hypothetical protein